MSHNSDHAMPPAVQLLVGAAIKALVDGSRAGSVTIHKRMTPDGAAYGIEFKSGDAPDDKE